MLLSDASYRSSCTRPTRRGRKARHVSSPLVFVMLRSGAFSTIFVSNPMGRRRKTSTIPLPLFILYAAIQCFLEVLHVFVHWDAHACIPCAAMSGDDRKMIHSQMRKARTRMRYADCGFIVLSSIVVCRSSLVARRSSLVVLLSTTLWPSSSFTASDSSCCGGSISQSHPPGAGRRCDGSRASGGPPPRTRRSGSRFPWSSV
jgi:hypothetical protein